MIEVLRPHPLRPLKADRPRPLTLKRGEKCVHISLDPYLMKIVNRCNRG